MDLQIRFGSFVRTTVEIFPVSDKGGEFLSELVGSPGTRPSLVNYSKSQLPNLITKIENQGLTFEYVVRASDNH